MGIKVDPRTGMIMLGPLRPSKFPPSSNTLRSKKAGNTFPARSLPQGVVPDTVVVQQSRGLTAEQLKQLAIEIGKTIAAQIGSVQAQANSAVQSQADRAVKIKIDIDESIADVGIGDQDPLEKGSGSGKIAKEATVEDNIAESKRALKALKTS